MKRNSTTKTKDESKKTERYELSPEKFLSPSEFASLMSRLHTLRAIHRREHLLFRVLHYTGARVTELLSLTKVQTQESSFLDIDNRAINIYGIKRSKSRVVPFKDSELFDELVTYAKEQPGNLVFDISYSRIWQLWKAFCPVKKGIHSLRHTRAIEIYKRRRQLKDVQTLLGHRNIANTMIYLDFVEESERLREVM